MRWQAGRCIIILSGKQKNNYCAYAHKNKNRLNKKKINNRAYLIIKKKKKRRKKLKIQYNRIM
jgi:hypothetical protein